MSTAAGWAPHAHAHADVLTSSNAEGLAYKLAQACAQREATDLSGLT